MHVRNALNAIPKYRFRVYDAFILINKVGRTGYARAGLSNAGQSLAKKGKRMDFKDFIHKLASVISAGGNTAAFTRSVFEAILSEEGQVILGEYKNSSYKSFFNGSAKISRLAKKINAYIEPMNFSDYIHQFSDAAVENLCTQFSDGLPDITLHNAGDLLADLFVSIITDAAGTTKKSTPKRASKNAPIPPVIISPNAVVPDLATVKDGVLYLEGIPKETDEDLNPFQTYLDTAVSYYSTKKTLLYAEKPHPFYDLYVCNDIRYRKFKITGAREPKHEKTIHNATIELLDAESKYIIIEGIGGIGKSMLLTHLFLSSAKETDVSERIPLLLSLKDYKEDTDNIVDFIWKSVKDFDPTFAHANVIDSLQNKELVLLMDGLDEIQSSVRDSFDTDLEAFIKSYPGNMIIITSRPVNTFIAYSKFSIFDIEPLTKPQALTLIEKLEFWDITAKNNFMEALDRHLYRSHYQFASNPLLLTIMLMTYSSFGEVPAKMHVFYSKAYETMARLHDATKGSYKRPLHTKLTPEDFSKFFAEFCARTYKDEELEFTDITFSSYMKKVLKDTFAEKSGITPHDFLLDLTDNLCIMYREGEKNYFIHRSFQEYFAAVHFASGYDAKLHRVGNFFEKMQHRSYTDRTFGMLYDMIPEKVERYIFLPYLQNLLNKCSEAGSDEEYWEFLDEQYPALYYQEGDTGEIYFNEAQSFIYKAIIKSKNLGSFLDLDGLSWPDQIYDLPARGSVRAYEYFLDSGVYSEIQNPEFITEAQLEDTIFTFEDELPYQYESFFGKPDQTGITIEIEICQLRQNPSKFSVLRNFMEQYDFPLFEEFQNVKKYYVELRSSVQKEDDSDDLFDD